jgi:Zn-dependent M28 family amino/carboxypeptidase
MRKSLSLVVGLALLSSACTTAAPRAAGGSGSVARVSVEGIRDHLEVLQRIADENGGTRAVGTPGYDASVRYVIDVLRGAGYEVMTRPTVVPVFTQGGPTLLEEIAPPPTVWTDGRDLRAMLYSASGEIRGRVTPVGFGPSDGAEGAAPAPGGDGCRASDLDGFPAGDVALLRPGECLRRQQVLNAQAAGASAVIVTYPSAATGRPVRPTLLYPDGIEVPAIAVTDEVGRTLISRAGGHPAVLVRVDASTSPEEAESVLTQTPSGDPGRVLMLGAHLDSVMDGPGIDDNGSGVAVVLEVARWLAGREPASAVRFAFWTGEEEGTYGSREYVDGLAPAERDAIAAYVNLDMIGSPNFARFVYADRPEDASAAEQSEAIQALFTRAFETRGLAVEPLDLGGGADHGAFAEAGIPVGGLFSGASEVKTPEQAEAFGGTAGAPFDACYHQPCDTIANLSDTALQQFADALVSVLSELASVG